MGKKKLNVLVTFQGYGGVQRHRIHDPFQHLSQFVNVQHTPSLDNLNDESVKMLEAFDVVVFNRNISNLHQPDQVFHMLKKAGIKIVMDIDDYWLLSKHHVAYETYQKTNLTNSMLGQLRHADVIWVTHERLGRAVNEYNPNWVIVPNAIDPVMFPSEKNSYTHTAFYQGSVTHRRDLQLIKDLPITICGNVDADPEWKKIRKMMPNAKWEDARDASSYHELYWDKGICVIPLLKNKFNVMKSNLKMIEAGWYKKPVIVTAIHPYTPFAKHKHNALLVKKGDYARKLKTLQQSMQFQDDLRFQLHEDILAHHMMDDVNKIRLQSLESLCQ